MFKYKDLLVELVKREVKSRYKQSVLGYAWVLLVPLINLVVLSLVFSYFVRIPTGDIPYPIFLFTALIPWMFTSNSIIFATSSLVSNSNLITKIYLPREIFPVASVVSKIIDFLLSILILFIFMFVYKIPLGVSLLYLPIVLVIHLLFVLGISFIFSAINVFYRDIENTMGVVTTLWMYLTPILYPQDIVPDKYLIFLKINPMTSIIESYRDVFLYNRFPRIDYFIYSLVFSVSVFVLGFVFFRSRSKYFADVI